MAFKFDFGSVDDMDEARRRYRRWARQLHPDAGGSVSDWTALDAAWNEFRKQATGEITIVTKKHTYTVESACSSDAIANLYPCSWVDLGKKTGHLKLPKSPVNNDLIANEAIALRKLDDADGRYRVYAPKLVETFRHKDPTSRKIRQGLVTDRLEGVAHGSSVVSLAQVRQAFPDGIDGRDIAWMWRRALVGIGWAHRAGIIHAALTPDNILIVPQDHGVILVNWVYSVTEDGDSAKAINPVWDGWYPPELLEKRPVSPATDIYTLSTTMGYLLGKNILKPFVSFIKGCKLARPEDAWVVKDDFDDLLERMYGPRKFRPFVMPEL